MCQATEQFTMTQATLLSDERHDRRLWRPLGFLLLVTDVKPDVLTSHSATKDSGLVTTRA